MYSVRFKCINIPNNMMAQGEVRPWQEYGTANIFVFNGLKLYKSIFLALCLRDNIHTMILRMNLNVLCTF